MTMPIQDHRLVRLLGFGSAQDLSLLSVCPSVRVVSSLRLFYFVFWKYILNQQAKEGILKTEEKLPQKVS